MKEYSVIIVVPIYKEVPDELENIALDQLFSVLRKYRICVVAPEKLVLESYNRYSFFTIERFANKYFRGVEGYTELLLSQEFYERFLKYEYMLIYQTDAFVFCDKLQYFCDLGFDFIGAPVKSFGWDYFYVGNGGFSLRKLSKCYDVVQKKEKIIYLLNEKEKRIITHAEDYYFGYFGWKKDIDFKVPSIWQASEFSVERDIGHGFRNILKKGLPFGCHHWNIMNYETWKPIIEEYGYKLPEKVVGNWETLETDRMKREDLFISYLLRHGYGNTKQLLVDTGLNEFQSCIVWGAGVDGRKCLKLLKLISINVSCIYDNAIENVGYFMGIPICKPQINKNNRKDIIIIATEKYQDEISDNLNSLGLCKNKDYYLFSDIRKVLRINLENVYPGIEGITKKFMIKVKNLSSFNDKGE